MREKDVIIVIWQPLTSTMYIYLPYPVFYLPFSDYNLPVLIFFFTIGLYVRRLYSRFMFLAMVSYIISKVYI